MGRCNITRNDLQVDFRTKKNEKKIPFPFLEIHIENLADIISLRYISIALIKSTKFEIGGKFYWKYRVSKNQLVTLLIKRDEILNQEESNSAWLCNPMCKLRRAWFVQRHQNGCSERTHATYYCTVYNKIHTAEEH